MSIVNQLVNTAASRRSVRNLVHRLDVRRCEKRLSSLGIRDFLLSNSKLEVDGVEALPPKWDDLWTLYSIIRTKKPALVLEYGSGVSTILMAQALWENGSGKLISLENVASWAELTRRRLPSRLEPVCEVLVAILEVATFSGFFGSKAIPAKNVKQVGPPPPDRRERVGAMGFRYREAEGRAPDFILIDGPDRDWVPEYRDSFGGAPPSIVFDPLIHERTYKPGTHIVLDSRLPNTKFLVGNLSRRWRFMCDHVRMQNHLTLVD